MEQIGVVAGVVGAVVALMTATAQYLRWLWQRGYAAGLKAAREDAVREAQAKEMEQLRKMVARQPDAQAPEDTRQN